MQKQRRRILQPVVHLALEQFLVYLKLPRERQERRTARLFSFVLAFPLILSPLALLYAVGLSPFRLLCCLGLCGSLVQGLDGGTGIRTTEPLMSARIREPCVRMPCAFPDVRSGITAVLDLSSALS